MDYSYSGENHLLEIAQQTRSHTIPVVNGFIELA